MTDTVSQDNAKKSTSFWKKVARVGFPLLGAGALVWLLDHIGWEQIGHAFSILGWSGAGVLFVLGFLENTLDAAALRAAVPIQVGLYRVLSYNATGAIVNNLVPGELGEVAKGTLLKKHGSYQDAITGTVLWNYIFKGTRPAVAMLAAVVAWIAGHAVEAPVAGLIFLSTIIAFLPYFGFKLLFRKGLAVLIVRLLHRLRLVRQDPEKLIQAARKLDTRIQKFRHDRPWDYLRVVAFQLLARITAWLTLYITIQLVGLGYSFGRCSLIYAGFNVASYIVMILPARLGVGESAGYFIFSLFGLDGGMGVIVYIILRIKALVTNGIPAVFRPK